MGYNNYSPILKKGRRIGYKGLILSSALLSDRKGQSGETSKRSASPSPLQAASTSCLNSQPKFSKLQTPPKKPKPSFQQKTVQEWMEKHYCEGDSADAIPKQQLWLHYKESNQLQDDQRSAFFSHIGNILGQPPFLKVCRMEEQSKKHSPFQFLRQQWPRSGSNLLLQEQLSAVRSSMLSNGRSPDSELSSNDVAAPVKGVSRSETEKGPFETSAFVPNHSSEKVDSISTIEQDAIKSPLGLPGSVILNLQDSKGEMERNCFETRFSIPDSPIASKDDAKNESKRDPESPNAIMEGSNVHVEIDPADSPDSNAGSLHLNTEDLKTGDGYEEYVPSDGSEAGDNDNDSLGSISESDVSHLAKSTAENKLDKERKIPSAIYERFKKSPYSLTPLNLPGRPASFQAYLTNVVKDPGKTNEKRVALYLASGTTSKHKNCAIRAFVAASFPPVKVGSFASELIDYTFEGDAFPQFTQLEKSNFSCAICIPHLKWAILNSIPHSLCRAKSASSDAILSGTAALSFSGMVQLKDHSNSKCHLEALNFFEKSKEATPCQVKKSTGAKREKPIYGYFPKSSDHLN